MEPAISHYKPWGWEIEDPCRVYQNIRTVKYSIQYSFEHMYKCIIMVALKVSYAPSSVMNVQSSQTNVLLSIANVLSSPTDVLSSFTNILLSIVNFHPPLPSSSHERSVLPHVRSVLHRKYSILPPKLSLHPLQMCDRQWNVHERGLNVHSGGHSIGILHGHCTCKTIFSNTSDTHMYIHVSSDGHLNMQQLGHKSKDFV